MIIITLLSIVAYDPCWSYPAYEKDNCYRAYQQRREDDREQRQDLQNLLNQANQGDNFNRAQSDDQAIQQQRQLQDLIKVLQQN